MLTYLLLIYLPIAQSLLNGAELVRQTLRAKLGTDLTISDDTNPFWHTGNRVKAARGRAHQPWEDYWRVAAGLVAGKGRASPEEYAKYVRRVIGEHLFPY